MRALGIILLIPGILCFAIAIFASSDFMGCKPSDSDCNQAVGFGIVGIMFIFPAIWLLSK